MTVCGLVNLETGGNKMDTEHLQTIQQHINANQILDNFSKSGRACTIVTLENGEYLVERLVYTKHPKTEDEILSLTLVLTRAVKSSYDPTSSVTSQRSLYGQKIPLNHYLTKLG